MSTRLNEMRTIKKNSDPRAMSNVQTKQLTRKTRGWY